MALLVLEHSVEGLQLGPLAPQAGQPWRQGKGRQGGSQGGQGGMQQRTSQQLRPGQQQRSLL